MIEIHLTKIRNYLLTKKLPIDILIEVQDHFVSQITDLQREDNLSFEEAFEKTKLSWDKELKPYWKGGLNLEDVSDFMRRMRKENIKANLFWALKWSWIPMALIFLVAKFFSHHLFGYLTIAILLVLVIFSIANYLKNWSEFRLALKYEKYILTLHQHSIFIFILIISPILNVFTGLINNPEKYQNILLLEEDWLGFFFVFISIFVIVFSVFYSLSAQKNYLRQIEKVKPFLQYLH